MWTLAGPRFCLEFKRLRVQRAWPALGARVQTESVSPMLVASGWVMDARGPRLSFLRNLQGLCVARVRFRPEIYAVNCAPTLVLR